MTTLQSIIKAFGGVIADVVVLLIAAAVLVFFWGLFRFISRVGGDEKAVTQGKNMMIWGVIALFVMVSVWGLVRFIGGELKIGNSQTLPVQRR
jgi:hypothetical protein